MSFNAAVVLMAVMPSSPLHPFRRLTRHRPVRLSDCHINYFIVPLSVLGLALPWAILAKTIGMGWMGVVVWQVLMVFVWAVLIYVRCPVSRCERGEDVVFTFAPYELCAKLLDIGSAGETRVRWRRWNMLFTCRQCSRKAGTYSCQLSVLFSTRKIISAVSAKPF